VADIRESPVEGIVHELKEFNVNVYGYDPLLPDSVIEHFGVKLLPKPRIKMDAIIITVAHKPFKAMSMNEILGLMNENPVVIDVRGMIDKKLSASSGLYYKCL
jgi:UDPglucose 6-dehydrogenase/UDP-N-acetyl-D-galactosamine dehydrogenase